MKLRVVLNVENLYNVCKWREHSGYLQPINHKPSNFIVFLLELLEQYDVEIYHSKSLNPVTRSRMVEWFREELYIFLRDLKTITTICSRIEILEHLGYQTRWIISEESDIWVKTKIGQIKWPWFEPDIKSANYIGWFDVKNLYSQYPTMRDIFMHICHDYAIRNRFETEFHNIGIIGTTLRELLIEKRASDLYVHEEDCDGC
jgi:hypothetical protein